MAYNRTEQKIETDLRPKRTFRKLQPRTLLVHCACQRIENAPAPFPMGDHRPPEKGTVMHVLRASQRSTHGQGSFHIERVRPGTGEGPSGDLAFGPLSLFDHANLGVGTVVRMHEHVNDEILSYMWRGTMHHEDRAGHKVSISARRLMMMNAGESFWHEERTPDEAVEMLQIFVRPRDADLPAEIAFFDRPERIARGAWSQIAGPEDSGAPLTIRNTVHVYDAQLGAGEEIETLSQPGLSPFLYVMDGVIEIGGETLGKGDAVRPSDAVLLKVLATSDATLVLFLVNPDAAASRSGSISGR